MGLITKIKRIFVKKKVKRKLPAKVVPEKKVVVDNRVAQVKVHGLKGMDDKQEKFFEDSIALMLTVLNSKEFRDQFLAMNPTERKGLTMQQVLVLLLDGKQKFDNLVDYTLDFLITIYGDETEASGTVGYTYINSINIYTHRFHIRGWMKQSYGQAFLAGHILHEIMHHLGFTHKLSHKGTLVYESGYLVRQLGVKHLKGQKLTPISRKEEEEFLESMERQEELDDIFVCKNNYFC